jgi:hypothetical protein
VCQGTFDVVATYAVGFARPDLWRGRAEADDEHPWHAVEAHRPLPELDGEVELAVCGAIVQVWGWQKWERVVTGRTACADCRRLTAAGRPASDPAAPAPRPGRRLRVVG